MNKLVKTGTSVCLACRFCDKVGEEIFGLVVTDHYTGGYSEDVESFYLPAWNSEYIGMYSPDERLDALYRRFNYRECFKGIQDELKSRLREYLEIITEQRKRNGLKLG